MAENLDALNCRMAHRTVRCATGHCPVRQPRHQAVGASDNWATGQSGDAPDSNYSLSGVPSAPALTSTRAGAHCSVLLLLCRRPLALYSRYSAGTLDSPVLHQTVR
jgi:hypothetical protein